MAKLSANAPPVVRGHPLWGNMRELRRAPLKLYTDMHGQFGDVICLRALPGFYWYSIRHPKDVEYVLHTNQHNYRKPDAFNKPLSLLIGNGLLVSEGAFWLRQRRLMQPAFHRQKLAALTQLMADSAVTLADEWEAQAGSGAVIDVAAEMMRVTLKVVSRALFSTDVSDEASRLGGAIREVFDHLGYRLNTLFAWPLSVPTPRNRRFLAAKRILDESVFHIINERRRTGEDPGDLLSMLLAARDEETGEAMTDEQLRDEVLILMVAGHETTGAALTWTWHLLNQHPEAREKMQAEIRQTLAGRTPNYDDLPKLVYTRQVFEEALRLYPPAWGVAREAIKDDQIGGYDIAKGTIINVSIWATHRHPEIWERPDEFDPQRFAPEAASARPKFAYYPFGGGGRQCIGNSFAMIEATLILATLAQRYRLTTVLGHPVIPDSTFALRAKHGLKMTIHHHAS